MKAPIRPHQAASYRPRQSFLAQEYAPAEIAVFPTGYPSMRQEQERFRITSAGFSEGVGA